MEHKGEIGIEEDYSKKYSEKSFFDKIINTAKKAGIKVIYVALILFYTMKKATTPSWAKLLLWVLWDIL